MVFGLYMQLPIYLYMDALIYKMAYIRARKVHKPTTHFGKKNFEIKKMPRLARQKFPFRET